MRLKTKYVILQTQVPLMLLLLLKTKYLMLVIQSKKNDYNTKVSEIENKVATDHYLEKYITTQETIKLASKNLTAKLKPENLASKNYIAYFVKKNRF